MLCIVFIMHSQIYCVNNWNHCSIYRNIYVRANRAALGAGATISIGTGRDAAEYYGEKFGGFCTFDAAVGIHLRVAKIAVRSAIRTILH